jgi:hypothetical protein
MIEPFVNLTARYGLNEVGKMLKEKGWENITEVTIIDKNRQPLSLGDLLALGDLL